MIHPSAVVEDGAQLGQDVQIGPLSYIGSEAIIGDGCVLKSHVVVDGPVKLSEKVTLDHHAVVVGHTTVGEGTQISSFAAVGHPPQHMDYHDEPTRVEIGSNCVIREYVTIHRGTVRGGGLTRVGNEVMLMAYCHIAHDCRVDDKVIMANGATLAGHVEVQKYANIGGLTAIHQFARIGRNAFIGGASAISMDVVPFASAAGNRAKVTGVNMVGMRRSGFSEEAVKAVRRMHRVIFRSNLRLEQAVEELEKSFAAHPEAQTILEFIQTSQRGMCR